MSFVPTKRQRVIVQGTIHEAKTRYADQPVGMQKRAALIAIAAMMCESGCRVLANANVPASLAITHDRLPWSADGLGHDHASVGSYQQQTGTAWTVPAHLSTMGTPNGWGTPKQLMTPATAAGKFFHAMEARGRDLQGRAWNHPGLTGWWQVAQHVQVSAFDGRPRSGNHYSTVFGGNYKAQGAKAHAALNLLWPTVSTRKPAKPLPAPKPVVKRKPKPIAKKVTVKVRSGQTLDGIADNWHTDRAHLVAWNRKKYPTLDRRPDYVLPGWKLRVR